MVAGKNNNENSNGLCYITILSELTVGAKGRYAMDIFQKTHFAEENKTTMLILWALTIANKNICAEKI